MKSERTCACSPGLTSPYLLFGFGQDSRGAVERTAEVMRRCGLHYNLIGSYDVEEPSLLVPNLSSAACPAQIYQGLPKVLEALRQIELEYANSANQQGRRAGVTA